MNNVEVFENALLGEKYYKFEHKSGLKVFVFPKDRQSASAILATEFGSIDNTYIDENGNEVSLPDGIAHFMEHKMFDNESGDSVDDIFSRLGADPNAFTSWDKTGYIFTCSSAECIYEALGELINFVTKPYFTDESVEKEQGIIGQEIAMCEDDPYDRCFNGMVRGLYENHPIRIEIVGSADSIAKITPKMLYDCHKRFYSPSNMALVVSANVDPESVMRIVDERLGDIRPAEKVIHKYPSERKGAYKKKIEYKMAVERPIFSIGFKDSLAPTDPILRKKRQMTCELLTGVVFSSSNSLYSSLFKRGIMTSPFSYGEDYGKSFAMCWASGECDDPELLINEVKKYIKNLKRRGISAEDFERRKKIIYASDVKTYDFTWDTANALFDNAFTGVDIFEEEKLLKEITLDDANTLLRELMRERNMTVSVILPNERRKNNGDYN